MKSPAYIAAHIRRVIKDGGSAPHAAEVQWFFKEEVASRGWYTAELRKVAVRFRRQLLSEAGLDYLINVADKLFRGRVLEEKVFAVFLLENQVANLTSKEFKLLESWLDRVTSWADHDGLLHYLIGPMILADQKRASVVFRWSKSRNRWHRRAAAVALIRSTRQKLLFPEIKRLTEQLLTDKDDMVQKGVGWLLRETVKHNPDAAVPYLKSIASKSPRLVLRTACETVPRQQRDQLLAIRPITKQRRARRALAG